MKDEDRDELIKYIGKLVIPLPYVGVCKVTVEISKYDFLTIIRLKDCLNTNVLIKTAKETIEIEAFLLEMIYHIQESICIYHNVSKKYFIGDVFKFNIKVKKANMLLEYNIVTDDEKHFNKLLETYSTIARVNNKDGLASEIEKIQNNPSYYDEKILTKRKQL